MKIATLKALKGSIAKWKGILAGKISDEGTVNCPLCRMFFFHTPHCSECPVKKKTGLSHCRRTPYEKWSNIDGLDGTADTPKLKHIAGQEVTFLTSLLPKKRQRLRRHGGADGDCPGAGRRASARRPRA